MRPKNLRTKIFLDSGDPSDTKKILQYIDFLDGQTTNPSLVAKNPQVRDHLKAGKSFSQEEALLLYRDIVSEISMLLPNGSVSVEVPASACTSAEEMYTSGKTMFGWIQNAHIKLPIIRAGLETAKRLVDEGVRVNMTLCFTESQAAAVASATRGAKQQGDVFISPFVGRLDDRGENGMSLVSNIIRMYQKEKSNTQVLAASIRTLDMFLLALASGTDIITAPYTVLKEWADKGMPVPGYNTIPADVNLRQIPYQRIKIDQEWQAYDIDHELTEKGLQRFTDDWESLLGISQKHEESKKKKSISEKVSLFEK
ncbi:MAG: transaldolase [Candidatus Moranbacteria bacterium CG_4_10_14_3_um_filter_45_9]|nr:MAG: hypothetical protein AUK19_01760 [Candidatus Moranbacteria bacterium CG2_30_45_14]PIX89908.1 MAG: transaldolase [Candidatus Moranbacteria bacterium CG_4_10_14_3_um_filter_45_9]